jgi:hypothetical protein
MYNEEFSYTKIFFRSWIKTNAGNFSEGKIIISDLYRYYQVLEPEINQIGINKCNMPAHA